MQKPSSQGRARAWFASRMFLIAGTIIAFLIIIANVRTYYRDYEIWQEIRALEQQKEQLSKRKLESMDILSYVMSDHFVEDAARTELDLRKPGEHVVVVSTPTTRINESDIGKTMAGQEEGNPIKWWYYFFSSRET